MHVMVWGLLMLIIPQSTWFSSLGASLFFRYDQKMLMMNVNYSIVLCFYVEELFYTIYSVKNESNECNLRAISSAKIQKSLGCSHHFLQKY